MIKPIDVYLIFRKIQARFNNRPYQLPKDFDHFLENRMSKKNRECLELAAKYFSTKWTNINIETFMECGFELFGKSFTYTKFFNSKIMKFYIERDKNKKRKVELNKKEMIKTAKFIKKFMQPIRNNPNISIIREYCRKRDGAIRLIVKHHTQGHIDKHFLVWMIFSGQITLTDDERALVPYVVGNYRDFVNDLGGINPFLKKLRTLL